MSESKYEILWHKEYETYQKTVIEAEAKPSYGEAANIVGIIEDVNAAEVRVDGIMKLSKA